MQIFVGNSQQKTARLVSWRCEWDEWERLGNFESF